MVSEEVNVLITGLTQAEQTTPAMRIIADIGVVRLRTAAIEGAYK
jgi:hypothetical protein